MTVRELAAAEKTPDPPLWFGLGPSPAHPDVWCFVFTNVDGRSPWAHWLLGFFRPGFRHCFAMRDDPAGLIIVQLTTAVLEVVVRPGRTVVDGIRETAADPKLGPIHVAAARYDGRPEAWVPRALTCVGVLRALAGMRGRVQTPRGLWRQLDRQGRSGWKWRLWSGRRCTQEAGDQPGA